MADLSELISEALQTIQDAQRYLKVRESLTANPEERAGIVGWYATLQESYTTLQESAANLVSAGLAIAPEDEPLYKMLSEQLDLTRRHVRDLHETYAYPNVDLVMGTLQNQLQMLAGPHGPGGGRPGTHGPGGGRPGGLK